MILETIMALSTAGPAAPTTIETRIKERLASFKGVMGVYAKHLGTGEAIAVEADRRFPTASVIKVAVMVEAFQQIGEGRLRLDQRVPLKDEIKVGGSGVLRHMQAGVDYPLSDLLYLMIALSDNTATNMIVALVGTKNVDDRMVALGLPQTRLYRPTFRGGHADVFPEEEKEYGLGSTTPREMARLLETIARGQAVSAAASSQMHALLKLQQVRTLIPRGLPDDETVVAATKSGQDEEKQPNATGLVGQVRNDVGIVETPKGAYVIAIFTRRVQDGRDSIDHDALVTGGEISRMLFDHFTR